MNTEVTAIKAAADQIIPRPKDTERHLEAMAHYAEWLEMFSKEGGLSDSDRVRIREFFCQMENFCDFIYDDLRDRLNQHDPAHGLYTSDLRDIVEAYK